MSFIPSPTQSDVQVALRTFLLGILPSDIEVISGMDNRVPEPMMGDFVVMTPIRRERIETNVDTFNDCSFMASISGITMLVTSLHQGSVGVGNVVFGTNVLDGTKIKAFGSGTGGTGTYTLNQSQVVDSELMATGLENDLKATKVVMQLDIHGPNSADNTQTIATLFRDDYAIAQLTNQFQVKESGLSIVPLYTDDAKQIPFINSEQQYELRYVLDVYLQANQVVAPPQQYFQKAEVALEEVL